MDASELASALARARVLLGESAVLKLQAFCEIAASGDRGIEQLALAVRLGAMKQTTSAAVRDLTDVDHLGRPGPGLVQIEVSPANRRFNVVRLTDAGIALARELLGAG